MRKNVTKTFNREHAISVIREAAERWPSSFIARRELPRFTGGLVSVGGIANRDSEGTGIPGAFRIGRQVVYPVQSVVDWLVSRLEG